MSPYRTSLSSFQTSLSSYTTSVSSHRTSLSSRSIGSTTSWDSTAESTCAHSHLISSYLNEKEKPKPLQLPPFLQEVLFVDNVSMSPLRLPLLSWVFVQLPRASLATVLRVNSGFYRAGIEVLHEKLDLAPHCLWPRFVDRAGEEDMYGDVADTIQLFCRQYSLSRSWLANVVRTVNIHPHSTAFCLSERQLTLVTGQTVPALPNLQVLRVHMTHALEEAPRQRSFHINEMPGYRGPACPLQAHLPQCPTLFRLRPRKLVVLGGPCVYRDRGLTVLPYQVTASVESYTLVLCPDADLLLAGPNSPIPDLRARAIISDITNAANAETITIIFYTPEPAEWRGAITTVRHGARLRDTWAGRFFSELARGIACLPSWQKVYIVNAGAIDKHGLAMDCWDVEYGMLALEAHFHAALSMVDDPLRHLDSINTRSFSLKKWARAATVGFITMEEYLRCHDVDGEFEDHEIAGWAQPGGGSSGDDGDHRDPLAWCGISYGRVQSNTWM